MRRHIQRVIMQYKEDRDEVDLSNYDIDDDTGTLCHVIWGLKGPGYVRGDLVYKIENEIEQWAKENIHNECFYTYESNHTEIVFYFKNIEDAFLFKLTWG